MQLLTIQEHKDLQQAVSARELYNFLEPTERFSNWFDRQLQYGFVDGEDYLGCEVFNALAKQTLADFFVSIDMAKEISMIQRSDKGRQARQYFIECERRVVEASQPVVALPHDYISALEALLITKKGEQAALEQVKELQPKADALDFISAAVNSLNARDTAKNLGVQPQKFNKWCIAHNWMYRDSKDKLQMCSKRLQQGFMEQRPVTYTAPVNRNGVIFYETRATTQPLFTAKGLTHLAGVFSIVHEVA